MRRVARIALPLLLAGVVTACGGSREPESRAGVPPAIDRERESGEMLADAMAGRRAAVIPRGFKIRRESTSGFSVAFPRQWKALDGRAARFPGVAQTLSRYNPGLALLVRGLSDPGSPLRLLAFDPDLHRGFATNANVLEVALAPAEVLREVRRLPSLLGPVRRRAVDLPAGSAHRLEFLRDYRWQGRRYWPVFAASARSLTLPA